MRSMISKKLTHQTNLTTNRLIRASLSLIILIALSRVLGVLLQSATAAFFGVSAELDSYLVASSIPQLVTALYASGATLILVPLLVKGFAADRADNSANTAISILIVIIIAVSTLGIVFAAPITKVLGFGFSNEMLATTAIYFRWLMIYLLLSAIGSIITGILNSSASFVTPGVGSVFQFIAWLSIVLITAKKMGIMALIYGAIAGTIVYIIVQITKIDSKYFRFSLSLTKEVRSGVLIPLSLVSLVVFSAQANVISDRFFASLLKVGSVSVLDYAAKFHPLLVGILAYAVTTPAYTKLSKCASDNDLEGFKKTLVFGIKTLMLTTIPLVIMTTIVREPIVELLFQRGKFVSSDTKIVATTLLFLAPAQIISAFSFLFTYALFAMKETKALVIIPIASLIANITFSFFLYKKMGVSGIALSSSLAFVPSGIILLLFLNSKLETIDLRQISFLFIKILFATFIGSLITWNVFAFLPGTTLNPFVLLTKILVSLAMGLSFYLLVLFFVKVKELKNLLSLEFLRRT